MSLTNRKKQTKTSVRVFSHVSRTGKTKKMISCRRSQLAFRPLLLPVRPLTDVWDRDVYKSRSFVKVRWGGNICWHLELSVQSDVNTAAVTAENPKVSFIQSSEFIWQVLEIISCFKVSTYFWPYSIFLFELCQRCKKQKLKNTKI